MTHRPSPKAPPRPFLAAAPEIQALAARLEDLAGRPEASPFETQAPADWARLGFAAQTEAERVALLEASAELLRRRPDLESFHRHGVAFRRRAAGPGKIAALFASSEGAHEGMGAALAAGFPRSASVIETFDRIFEALEDPPLSQALWGADPQVSARLRAPVYAHLGAVGLAAGQYAVLRAGGFAPDMFAGYGAGEVAALWAAGALDEETLGALLYARARAMSAPDPRRPSGNLRVLAAVERSEALIRESGLRVFVTRHEAPNSHVVGGEVEELEAFAARLLGKGVAYETLPGPVAWHSLRAEIAAATFAGALRRARIGDPKAPVYGGELAEAYRPGETAERLERQLLRPLRFQETIERMYAEGARIFVEFGPGDGLTRRVTSILEGRGHLAVAMDTGEPEASARRIMEAAATLAAAGAPFRGEAPPPLSEFLPPAPDLRAATPAAEAAPEEAPQPQRAAPVEIRAEAPAEEVFEEAEEAPEAPASGDLLGSFYAPGSFAGAEAAPEEAFETEFAAEFGEAPQAAAQAEAEPEPEIEIEPEIEAEAPAPLAAAAEILPEPEAAPQEAEPEAQPEVEARAEEPEEAPTEEPQPQAPDLLAVPAPEPQAAEIPAPALAAAPEIQPEPEPELQAPPEPPKPLTGAALALRLAEQVSAVHTRFLENQTAALRAMLDSAADPETRFAIEEARREAADAHRLYLEGVVALSGVRPRLNAGATSPAPFVLAALAAQEADWPPPPEAAEEEPYLDPPERFAPRIEAQAAPAAPQAEEAEDAVFEDVPLYEDEASGSLAAEAAAAPEPEPEPEEVEEAVLVVLEPAIEAEAEAAPVEAPPVEAAAATEIEVEAEAEAPEAEAEAAIEVEIAAAAVEVVEETLNLPALAAPLEIARLPEPEAPAAAAPAFEAPPLTRLAFRLSPISAPPLRQTNPGDARWLILGEETLAAALAATLKREAEEEGAPCETAVAAADVGAVALFRDGGPWTGLVYLHAPGEEESLALARLEILRSLTESAQEAFHDAAARGERRVFAAVARLDGRLGYGPQAVEGLGASAFGLVKALAAAEPNFFCRAVDLAAALPLEEAAARLAAELRDADRGRVELALNPEGRFESLPVFDEADEVGLREEIVEGELFALVGDARGLATLWLEEAAARAPRRFLLLGPHRLLADEPAWAIGLTSEETLRWAAFQALEAEGADEERAAVGAVALSEAVVADRETRACLAELRRLGSEAAYATIDFDAHDAADQIAGHLEEAQTGGWEGPVSVFYAPIVEQVENFSLAFRRRLRRVETLLDGFSGAEMRRLWFLPAALDANESLSESMADEAVRRFAMGARAMGIDVRALLWAVAEEVEPGVVAALAEELRRPAPDLGFSLIGGAESYLSLRRVEPEALSAGGAALRADWSGLFDSAALEQHRVAGRPALPGAFALAAAFAAIERFAPGWRALGCEGVSFTHLGGLRTAAQGEAVWVSVGLRSAEWIDEATLRADLDLLDALGESRLRIEGARFSAHPPGPPGTFEEAEVSGEPQAAAAFYEDKTLPHGPDLRFLAAYRMAEGAEAGAFALTTAPVAGTERAALFDPVLAEAMAQAAVAAARRRSGLRGMPMRLEALRVWAAAPEGGDVFVEANLRREAERAEVWRLVARDAEGAPLMSCDLAAILAAPAARPQAAEADDDSAARAG